MKLLNKPFTALSIEIVYRGLYFLTHVRQRGETDDVVTFLAAEEKFLGILKRKRQAENPSPSAFLQNLSTDISKPQLVTDAYSIKKFSPHQRALAATDAGVWIYGILASFACRSRLLAPAHSFLFLAIIMATYHCVKGEAVNAS